MDEIKALISIVSKQKLKKLEVITSASLTSKSKTLYNGIATGDFRSDDDAANALYGTDANNPSYKKLKARLTEKLLNTVFIIRPESYTASEYSKSIMNMSRDFLAAFMVTKALGSASSVSAIFEKLVRLSEKYEEPSIGLISVNPLFDYFGFVKEDKKKLDYYSQKSEKFAKMLINETKILKYYGKVSQQTLLSRTGYSEEYLKLMQEVFDFISGEDRDKQSYVFSVRAYELIAHYYQVMDNSKARISACLEGLELFLTKPFKYDYGPYMLRMELVECFLGERNYQEASKYLDLNRLVKSKSLFNFFKLSLVDFSIKSATYDWQALYELTIPIINKSELRNLSVVYDSWLIREAYVYFLIKIGKIDTSDTQTKPKRKFKLSRNLNDLPTYSKSKRGINIPIIILQLLFAISDKKYDEINSRVQALNQYCYKYLRQDETYRSNCFIKMLLKLPEAEYHPLRLVRYADKYRKRLAEKPFKVSFRTSNSEVIPYEVLWDFIMEMLNINLKSVSKKSLSK